MGQLDHISKFLNYNTFKIALKNIIVDLMQQVVFLAFKTGWYVPTQVR